MPLRTQRNDRERFLRTTSDHRMTVLKDDGLYRHIHVGKPGSSNRHFNITTVPGYLFFTGDMGSYTFTRTRDMFDFMNINWDRETPMIDYRYWAEKCEAADRRGCLTRYDDEGFRDLVVQVWREHYKSLPWLDEVGKHERNEFHYNFWHEVLDMLSPDDERGNLELVMDWRYYSGGEWVLPFEGCLDWGPFETHTDNFRWVCWAIASTIRDYHRGGDRVQRQAAHDKLVLGVRLTS